MNQAKELLDKISDIENTISSICEGAYADQGIPADELLETLYILTNEKNQLEETFSTEVCNLTESESLDMLQEVNIRRLDRKTQLGLRKIFIAIQMAKQNNDPLYDRYRKGVMLRKTMKQMIINKYGGKAYQKALAELNNRR